MRIVAMLVSGIIPENQALRSAGIRSVCGTAPVLYCKRLCGAVAVAYHRGVRSVLAPGES